ncbi:MAG: agmatine deiminase family protein [Bacteroidales bacterium]|nr:agmatine deiminase family protein [Bacteroidales bacterium]
MISPKSRGYFFPAEWFRHEATWLTFPFHEESFPGKMDAVLPSLMEFIKVISQGEKVRVNVHNSQSETRVKKLVEKYGVNPLQVELFIHPSDDVWCRDHGPAFLINPGAESHKKVIVNWEFNAWGGKYPYMNDNSITELIAKKFGLKTYNPAIVMEGGSVDFNGAGTLVTSTACLLNNNRNPRLKRRDIEYYLCEFYGVEQVLWLHDGIAGDDTDGHIDDIARFVSEDTVVAMVETDKNDINYIPLQNNLKLLKSFRLLNGKPLNVIEIPMPDAVYHSGQRLPASYANFYICNSAVVVPTFRCSKDHKAIDILSGLFPGRKVTGIDATDIVWGFGSFHCLSQQEPEV